MGERKFPRRREIPVRRGWERGPQQLPHSRAPVARLLTETVSARWHALHMKNSLTISKGARAWVAVVSRAHVERGAAGGFIQVCHGKRAPLERMQPGDWIAYYSPTTEFRGGEPLRAFTAIGRVLSEATYPFDMGGGFVPFRKDVAYATGTHAAQIHPLLPRLHFAQRTPNWGMLARRGHFEIDPHDLTVIATAMGCALKTARS